MESAVTLEFELSWPLSKMVNYYLLWVIWTHITPATAVWFVPCVHWCFISIESSGVASSHQASADFSYASHAVSPVSGRTAPPSTSFLVSLCDLPPGFTFHCGSFQGPQDPLPSSLSSHCCIPVSEHQISKRIFYCSSLHHLPRTPSLFSCHLF